MKRRTFLSNTVGLLATGLYTGGAYSLSEEISTTRINLAQYFPQYAAGIKLAFVADIHDGPFIDESLYINLFKKLKAEQPDILLLGGDYIYLPNSLSANAFHELSERNTAFTDPSKQTVCLKVIDRLSEMLADFSQVHMVLGNHDKHNMFSHNLKLLTEYLLVNEKVNVTIKGIPLEIVGVDDFITGLPKKSSFSNFDSFKIVLAHNPDHFYYLEDREFHLGLSGHTHWGQINLPLIGPATYNVYNPHYYQGMVIENPNNPNLIYVTAGIGTVEIPYRRGVPREIVIFEL